MTGHLTLLGVLLAVGLSQTAPALFNAALDAHWDNFKTTYQRNYFAQEDIMRRSIWEKNVNEIQQHNLKADMGVYSYWLGINKYADMSPEEVSKYLANYRAGTKETGGAHFLPLSNVEVPDEVDWRTKGYVTPIKDQGRCGSCWTFSTTGSLEGQHFRATGKLVSLSEQQIVDCSQSYGMHGCHGGLMDIAFTYIKDRGGLDTEASYPYTAMDGTCHYNKTAVGATVTGFTDVPAGDEEALKQAVATVGPVSVAIDATGSQFHFYKSGVYNNVNCTNQLDHAVLAVGYGTENGQDYWLVKNSWGTTWGDQGYIKMSRNANDQCGIASKASYPLV